MVDEKIGEATRRYGRAADLVHAEVMLPANPPEWLSGLAAGTAAQASEAIWNNVQLSERQANGQLAREIVIALPAELSREQNIALMREFVAGEITARGFVADWVYHDAVGNPHVHLMHTLRPVRDDGWGMKKVAVPGEDGRPLRVNNKIVYKPLTGGPAELTALRMAWGETANRHLALAGFEPSIDMRSYAARGVDLVPTTHLGPGGTHVARKLGASEAWAAREVLRFATADRIIANPAELLKLVGGERSTFTEHDLAKTLHRFVDDPATFVNVRAAVMASRELVELRGRIVDPATGVVLTEPVYSTREIVRIEHDMAVAADRLAERRGFDVAGRVIAQAVRSVETKNPDRAFKFDAEQVAAVEHVTGAGGIACVVGFAGAGKSTLLEAANLAWTAEGRRVFGAALAGKAAEGLEGSSGIASRTLASWELAWRDGRDPLRKGDVFVIDEAGMVASGQMSRVLQVVERAGAKAVLVGDAMQLQPIEAGAAFRAITERTGYVELAGIRRQREEWAREASRQFARGQVNEALEAYRSRGHVVEAADRDGAMAAIVADWAKARQQATARATATGKALRGDELLVLAHSNADVFGLNAGIREVMKGEGALGEARPFVSERGMREFAVGDRMIFLRNARFEDKFAPELGRQQVRNGMLGIVVATSRPDGGTLLRVRLDSGREVAFSEETYRNVDHGYAATVHKSQGVTVDRVLVMASATMDRHLAYVAMSRHRDEVRLYAARSEFRDFDTLAKTLGRSAAKSTTLDFAGADGYRAAVDRFAERRGIETLASLASGFAAFVERQRAWIAEQRAGLAQLWSRAERAIGLARGEAVEIIRTSEPQAMPAAREEVAQVVRAGTGFAAVTDFARSREADAHLAVIERAEWQQRLAQLRPLAEAVYREPEAALTAIVAAASAVSSDGSRAAESLARTLAERPQAFGAVKGGEREAVAELSVHARSLAGYHQRAMPEAVTAEDTRRAALAVAVPDLSEAAQTRLAELAAVRASGDPDAWRAATRMVMADQAVSGELTAAGSAIAARFGERAFTERARPADLAQARSRVPDNERAQLERITDTLAGVRAFAAEAGLVQRMEAARVQHAPKEVPAPLFAAVTGFAASVEEVARARTAEHPGYRQPIDDLAASAAKIWQDPAAAVDRIERAIALGTGHDGKLEAALRENPTRAGALRGSDRLMDRFSAAGAARRAALDELPAALSAVRHAEGVYHNVLKSEINREEGARERMAIEVPALSEAARTALDRLADAQGQDRARALQALPREVMAEFATVNAALDRRFGYRAFADSSAASIADLARQVAPGQREALDRLHLPMKTLQQAVHHDIAERHQARLQQSVNRGPVISREWEG